MGYESVGIAKMRILSDRDRFSWEDTATKAEEVLKVQAQIMPFLRE